MKERCAFRYQYYYRMFIVKESVIKIIDLTDSQLFFFVCFLNRTVYTSYVLGRAKVIILMKKKTNHIIMSNAVFLTLGIGSADRLMGQD